MHLDRCLQRGACWAIPPVGSGSKGHILFYFPCSIHYSLSTPVSDQRPLLFGFYCPPAVFGQTPLLPVIEQSEVDPLLATDSTDIKSQNRLINHRIIFIISPHSDGQLSRVMTSPEFICNNDQFIRKNWG